ncbi:MAG TPA: hypothetical protein VIL74_09530 [Pyrinomonadaceae bacterium]|jgi:hypothetical protein
MKTHRHKKASRQFSFAFESFGVKVRIQTWHKEVTDEIEARLDRIIPAALYKKIEPEKAAHVLSIGCRHADEYVIYRGRRQLSFGQNWENVLKYFDWQIRLTIAEFARERVFLHAGVVGWKGKAIIIPAKSFQGKTTLVKTLTRMGAQYYSDEYAVLDAEGYVHPFPKMLSIRGFDDPYRQIDYPVESLGGKAGTVPLPVGLILLTEYQSGAEWEPQILSDGNGVMELLSHTIPIRYKPKFSLKVLNKTVNRAIIVKTKRGEAEDFATSLLSFFENKAL